MRNNAHQLDTPTFLFLDLLTTPPEDEGLERRPGTQRITSRPPGPGISVQLFTYG